MDDREPLDPLLQDVVQRLRMPVPIDPGLDERIRREIRSLPRRRHLLRRTLMGAGLALAAGLAGLLFATRDKAPPGGLQPVHFSIRAGTAASVAVVGDFNEWDPAGTPLARIEGEEWRVTVSLPPGRYRFSFLLDGRTWVADSTRQLMPDPDFHIPTSLVQVEGSSL